MSSLLLVPIALFASFVFGSNNAGLSTGSLVASGFSYRKGIALTGAGFIAGFLLEGWKMGGTVNALTPSVTMETLLITLIVTGVFLSIFSFIGFPISLVNVLVAAFVGSSIAVGVSVDFDYLNILVGSWVVLPFVAALITIGVYRLVQRLLENASPLGIGKFHLITVPILAFYVAYSLGANNIGLLYSLSTDEAETLHILALAFLPVAALLGVMKSGRTSLFVSEGVVGHSPLTIFSSLLVGAFLTWGLTQVALPVSLSQVLIGALIGVNLYRKPRTYNKNALAKLVVSWVGITVISFVVAYLLQFVI